MDWRFLEEVALMLANWIAGKEPQDFERVKLMVTQDQEALEMAKTHYQVEPGLTRVFRIHGEGRGKNKRREPVALLEVNEFTPPSGIMPLRFGPNTEKGFRHPVVIVEITPEELEQLEDGKLKLPDGWIIGEPIPNPLHETNGAAR